MPRAGASVPPPPAAGARGTDLKTGYLEKRIGEHSSRSSLPDAFRWQRRYFVLTESRGMLYYFKSPDDPPNYKGVLSLRDCKIDDLDADESGVRGGAGAGNGGSAAVRSSVGAASSGKYDLDGGAGGGGGAAAASASSSSLSASTSSLPGSSNVSLLFRISHRDPTRAVYKNHASLVLRAESPSEKYSWLARLRAAAASAANGPPDASASTANPAASPRSAAGPLASGAAKRSGAVNGSSGGDGGNIIGRRSTTDVPTSPPQPPAALVQPRPATIPASGIGSALAHGVSSKLGPEPPYAYGPSSSTSSSSWDAFLEALGADTASYVRTVCATIAVTVPKAAVHCQVKRAQGHLLEALYAAVSSLPPNAASGLLAEDGDAGARRAAAAAQSFALADAYGKAAAAREAAVSTAAVTVALPASVVEIAGGARGSGGTSSNGGGGRAAPPPRVSVVTAGNDNGSLSSAAPTPTATTSPSPMPRRRPPPAPPSDVKTG